MQSLTRRSVNALRAASSYGIDAGRVLRTNVRFLAIALLLSSACFASSVAAQQTPAYAMLPSHRDASAPALTPSYVLRHVLDPLSTLTNVGGPWVRRIYAEDVATFRSGDSQRRSRLLVWGAGVAVLAFALEMLMAVGVLGCLWDRVSKRRAATWAGHVRAHYLSLAALVACVRVPAGLLRGLSALAPLWLMPHLPIGWHIYEMAVYLPPVLLVIAPYAIVGSGVGAWRGAKTGILLLWRNALIVGVLLVLCRIGMAMVELSAAHVVAARFVELTWDRPGSLVSHWLLWTARSALGLWLATGLFLVVSRGSLPRGDANAA